MTDKNFEEKLTQILDYDIINKFNIDDLKKNFYIPLYIKNNVLYGISYMPQLRNSLLENIESLFGKIEMKTRKVSVSQFHTTLKILENNIFETFKEEDRTISLVDRKEKLPKQILSIIPEDFIKLYMVFPLKYEKNNLILGMVNPSDENAINEIVFFTGLKPQIQQITLDEFKMYIRNLL